jgi:hypothetical protein
MGRGFSFGLGRVLQQIGLTSVGARHRSPAQSSVLHPAFLAGEVQNGSADAVLSTGQRRILEHVAMTSVERRLKMPR